MFKLFSQKVVPQLLRYPIQSIQIRCISRKSIYVGNLPWSTRRSDIEDIFVKYGSIYHVNYPVDNMGRHKGIAFVEMDAEPADQALAHLTENLSLGGRRIVLGLAKNQPGDKNLFPRTNTFIREEAQSREVERELLVEESNENDNRTFLANEHDDSAQKVEESKQDSEEGTGAKDEPKA